MKTFGLGLGLKVKSLALFLIKSVGHDLEDHVAFDIEFLFTSLLLWCLKFVWPLSLCSCVT